MDKINYFSVLTEQNRHFLNAPLKAGALLFSAGCNEEVFSPKP